jgi:hypothetical protein
VSEKSLVSPKYIQGLYSGSGKLDYVIAVAVEVG